MRLLGGSFWAAAAVALLASGWATAAAGAPEVLTLATYNVENYVAANRMTAAGYRENYPKPEAQKAALRRVIRALGADVLALQEMGPRPYLDELQRDLKADGCDYPYAALATAADADRHLALLSRRPLGAVTTLTDLSFSYFGGRETVKRGLLRAAVKTDAGELTVFVVHLKSRFTDRADDPESGIRRAAEAFAVRDAILRQFPQPAGARFVLLGDCNDTRGSKTIEHLQHRGDTPVAFLLPAEDSRGETWTHHFRRADTYSRVDHIFVSAALRDHVEAGRAVIFDGPGASEASDHRPVLVRLRVATE